MSNIDIIRAWKDSEYRDSLTEEQKAQLPDNPAGTIHLTDEQMGTITGGGMTSDLFSFTCNPDCSFTDRRTRTFKDTAC